MLSKAEAKRLHDRATRGMALSAAEQAALEAWYAQKDAEEQAALAGTPSSRIQDELRAEIGAVVSRLRIVTEEIEAQAAENERLRGENALLQHQLLERRTAPQT